ncbi:MAG: formylglycine-generating enzyme family protein [Treponema sp.]|nr:formylglycine-generating enzyme family protein [Treponema sp.]
MKNRLYIIYSLVFIIVLGTCTLGGNLETMQEEIINASQNPAANDYNITNLTQTFGNITNVTITPKDGKSSGAITILYNGSTTLPAAAGTHTVTFNVKAARGWNAASGLAGGTLTINAAIQTPVASDFNIGNLTQTVGSVTPVTITPKTGKSNGAITVFYNDSQTLPAAAGTYTVTFNVAAAAGWNAVNGLAGGTLTINSTPNNNPNSTPVANDYNISNLTQTVGSVTPVTITAKAGKSNGAITILYNGSTMLPSAAGTYTVTFNVEAAAGWSAAYGLAGGTLTINAENQNPSENGIQMSWIPAGTYTRGQDGVETPTHQVTLSKGFYMGKYEVTQEHYQAVTGVNPSYFSSSPASGEVQERRPVEWVTWYDAVEFCNKLSEQEGLTPAYTITGRIPTSGYPITAATVTWNHEANGYRLPTEAEWEYACRAGTTTAYNTGDTISNNTGWYNSNSGSKTHEVGLKPPNAWGLYDMHGNVWEWCWDWYASYSSGAQTDPVGAASGDYCVDRGGSWNLSASYVRSAFRYYYAPSDRAFSIGFRVVRN